MSTVDWTHPAEGPAPVPALGARPDAPVAAVLALGANPVSYTHLTLPTNREV